MQSIKCFVLFAIVTLVGALIPHDEAANPKQSPPPGSAKNSPRTSEGLFLNQKTSSESIDILFELV